MRYLIVLSALVLALAASATATAGGWATVELASLPDGARLGRHVECRRSPFSATE